MAPTADAADHAARDAPIAGRCAGTSGGAREIQEGTPDTADRSAAPGRLHPVTALAPGASLAEAIVAHWREFLMEGAELGALMLSICSFGALLYSRRSPLHALSLPLGVSAALMGTAVALTTLLIIRSPFGRRSGAHFNPAVTLSFLWLGRIRRWDAVGYVVAHFVGGAVGVGIAHQLFGARLSEAEVRYLVTIPGSHGYGIAFLAEIALSGLLMSVVLYASNHRRLSQLSPVCVALLTILYYAACPSISGFSVNPARSFSSALFAWIWQGIWIYFTAPCLGMLMAAGTYIAVMGADRVYCAKVFHDTRSSCPFPCRFDRLSREV